MGSFPTWAQEELERRKVAAQEAERPEPIVLLGGVEFFVHPKGTGFWTWVISNPDMIFRFGSRSGAVAASVRLSAWGLASRGAADLWREAVRIGAEFSLAPGSLTRIDVAADFQGWAPGFEEMRHVKCPSTFRPVYPNADSPETFQYGKGGVVLRVYNKSKEIAVNNHGWWQRVWKLSEGWEPGCDVWRAEVQLRTQALKELGYRDVNEALVHLDELFRHGLEWCSLVTPTSDSNKARWPEHPQWTELKTLFGDVPAPMRTRDARRHADIGQVTKRYLSALADVGAIMGSQSLAECQAELSRRVGPLLIVEHANDFASLVEKRRRIRCGS
jgi:hypothetical protein